MRVITLPHVALHSHHHTSALTLARQLGAHKPLGGPMASRIMAHNNASSNAQDTLAFLALPWHKADCHRGVRIARQDYPPVALVASARKGHTHTRNWKLQGQRWQSDFYYFAHVLMTTCSPRFSALLCICLVRKNPVWHPHAHKKQAERGRPPPPPSWRRRRMLLHAASLPDLEHPPESLGDMSFSEKIPSLAT